MNIYNIIKDINITKMTDYNDYNNNYEDDGQIFSHLISTNEVLYGKIVDDKDDDPIPEYTMWQNGVFVDMTSSLLADNQVVDLNKRTQVEKYKSEMSKECGLWQSSKPTTVIKKDKPAIIKSVVEKPEEEIVETPENELTEKDKLRYKIVNLVENSEPEKKKIEKSNKNRKNKNNQLLDINIGDEDSLVQVIDGNIILDENFGQLKDVIIDSMAASSSLNCERIKSHLDFVESENMYWRNGEFIDMTKEIEKVAFIKMQYSNPNDLSQAITTFDGRGYNTYEDYTMCQLITDESDEKNSEFERFEKEMASEKDFIRDSDILDLY